MDPYVASHITQVHQVRVLCKPNTRKILLRSWCEPVITGIVFHKRFSIRASWPDRTISMTVMVHCRSGGCFSPVFPGICHVSMWASPSIGRK